MGAASEVVEVGAAMESGTVVLAQGSAKQFLGLLEPLRGVAAANCQLPILEGVLWRKSSWGVTVLASDLDRFESNMARLGDGDGDAAAVVEYRPLMKILKGLGKTDQVSLAMNGAKVSLVCGLNSYELVSHEVDEFPIWNARVPEGSGASFEVGGAELHNAISSVSHSMGIRDIRFYLNGMYFELQDGAMKIVATDGYRMAGTKIACKHDAQWIGTSFTVPRSTVLELMRNGKQQGDTVEGSSIGKLSDGSAGVAVFRQGTVELKTKLLDGVFPDYTRVLQAGDTRLDLPRAATLAALKRLLSMKSGKFRGVRIELSDGRCTFTASNAEQKMAKEQFQVSYTGRAMIGGVNIDYLIDAFGACTYDTAVLCFKESEDAPGAAALYSVLYREDPYFTSVIMPMAL